MEKKRSTVQLGQYLSSVRCSYLVEREAVGVVEVSFEYVEPADGDEPGQVICLTAQVAGQTERVVEGPEVMQRQVEAVVEELAAVDRVDEREVAVDEGGGEQLPCMQVVVDPVETCEQRREVWDCLEGMKNYLQPRTGR